MPVSAPKARWRLRARPDSASARSTPRRSGPLRSAGFCACAPRREAPASPGSGDEEAAAQHPPIIAAPRRSPVAGWPATVGRKGRPRGYTGAPREQARRRATETPTHESRSARRRHRAPVRHPVRPCLDRPAASRSPGFHFLRACHDCIADEPLSRSRRRHPRPGARPPRQADRLGRRDGRAHRRQGRLLVRRQRRRVRAPRRAALRRRHLHQARSGAAAAQLPGAQQPERRRPGRGPHLHLLRARGRRRPDQQLEGARRDARAAADRPRRRHAAALSRLHARPHDVRRAVLDGPARLATSRTSASS